MVIAGIEYKDEIEFYKSYRWQKIRKTVLNIDHHECQLCKKAGKLTPANTVHHVNHLKDRPDLAMDIWHAGERNLVSLCHSCHEKVHPEKAWKTYDKDPITEERW